MKTTSQFKQRCAGLCAAIFVLWAESSFANYGYETQTFDNATSVFNAGWTGSGNSANGNSYGFSNTDNTAGASPAGEAGGLFARSTTANANYYGDTTLLSHFTLNDTFIEASGELALVQRNDTQGVVVQVGHFVPTELFRLFMGFRIQDGPGSVDFSLLPVMIGTNFTGGVGAEVGPATTLSPGTYTWSYVYNPHANGADGALTLFVTNSLSAQVVNSTAVVDALTKSLRPGWQVNAFGFNNGATGTDDANQTDTIFIDNVIYSAIPEPSALAMIAVGVSLFVRRRNS
jgi:hypothetical protein